MLMNFKIKINFKIPRFKNLPGGPERKSKLFRRVYLFLKRLKYIKPTLAESFVIPTQDVLQKYVQYKKNDTITWLGHSSFLIKINGKTILTDPFLTDHASPIAGLGPKRFTPPGLTVDKLPPIDILLVSHDHYDHCDAKTIIHIANKANIHVVAPLKLGKLFKKFGYQHIHELGWYDSWSFEDITIHGLPAYHYSRRNIFTHNVSLWASYMIDNGRKKIYFSGDTAYGSVFKSIGETYGPFDYALISIGSYHPPELMLASHLSPSQAVQVGRDLRAKTLVAMHWGTLVLSDEPPLEPPLLFHEAGEAAQYSTDKLWILNIGETRKLE